MIRAEVISTAAVPDGNGELQLLRRPLKPVDEFTIRIAGGAELMNSRRHGSEDALGELACSHIRNKSGAQVLIGGLGMGFTLAAALAQLPADARVTISELVSEVVDWNREWLGQVSGHPLTDPRVNTVVGDVGEMIRNAQGTFDAIVLDVDNGPEALTHASNAGLYSLDGLAQAAKALRKGGALLVWSSSPDRAFTRRLAQSGFRTEEHTARSHKGKGSRHIIWVATSD